MNRIKVITVVAGALVLVAVGFGIFKFLAAGKARDALAASKGRQEVISARIAALENRIQTETKRAQAVENDNAMLRAALQEAETAKASAVAAAAPPITRDEVDARYRQARELARKGEAEAALKEFLWCFDVGMRRISSFGGVRGSYLLTEIANLGPAGIAALEERRSKARQILLTGTRDSSAAGDFASISRKLNDEQAILALHDQIPPGEARQSFALRAFDQLVEARRYSDAMGGRSYASMTSSLELMIQDRGGLGRDHAIAAAAKNIEVLAGAGDLTRAKSLMVRLLAHDSSEATKALVERHLKRAGHPELLASPTGK
jgi:hypothetical protein